jgi:tetratricopeptide (TPR) repeat protein
MVQLVRDNFYSVQQQYDVFYWIGRIYYGLNRLDDALKSFADSLLTFGESSSALYYMAACYEVKKDYQTALRLYQDTLRVEPTCEFTKGGIKRVEEVLAGGAR